MSDDPNAREEGFYWVVLGHNSPEIAYWERGEWWLAGDARPRRPDTVTVLSDKLVFNPRPTPAGRNLWHPCRVRRGPQEDRHRSMKRPRNVPATSVEGPCHDRPSLAAACGSTFTSPNEGQYGRENEPRDFNIVSLPLR